MPRRLLILASLWVAAPVMAQDARLQVRFPSEIATRFGAMVDSAAREGLPTEPLVLRALEGAAKGAPTDRIMLALTNLHGSLRLALNTLGRNTDVDDLATAATALQKGLAPSRLVELQFLRGKRSLTPPLGAYLDLVQRGAEPGLAWGRIADMARRQAPDRDFVRIEPADLTRPPRQE
jgi:hypothetical protein